MYLGKHLRSVPNKRTLIRNAETSRLTTSHHKCNLQTGTQQAACGSKCARGEVGVPDTEGVPQNKQSMGKEWGEMLLGLAQQNEEGRLLELHTARAHDPERPAWGTPPRSSGKRVAS